MSAIEPSGLALFWAAVIAVAILVYVILDGFDLGVGILFGTTRDAALRDQMMAAISPFWDGNETWLVVVGASLFGAFPMVYAVFLPAFYIPVLLLLLALIFRGVAFEFRYGAGGRALWDWGFFLGSTVAAFVQGAAVGAMIRGIPVTNGQYAGGPFEWLRPLSVLTGIGLVLGYALLGACWLTMKSEGALRDWAWRRISRLAGAVLVVLGIAIIAAFIARADDREFVPRPPLGARIPRRRLAGDGRRLHWRARALRRRAVRNDGRVLPGGVPVARGDVLALHDPLHDHCCRRGGAGEIAVVSLLGRRCLRAADNRDLHRGRLLGVPRQTAARVWRLKKDDRQETDYSGGCRRSPRSRPGSVEPLRQALAAHSYQHAIARKDRVS